MSVPTHEHRCSNCYGVYGKSAIRCKNEPTTQWQAFADKHTADLAAQSDFYKNNEREDARGDDDD